MSASVSSTSGNTDNDRTYLAGEPGARAELHRVTLGADLNQASEDGVDTLSRTHAYLRYDRFFGPRWYLDANANRLLRTRSGLRFAPWKSFVAAVQLNYDRDETPSPGREKSDQAWLLNLGYTW